MFLTYLKNSYPGAYNTLGLERPDVLEGPIDVVILESLVTFVAGEVTGNSSHVDRVWTFLPPLYTGEPLQCVQSTKLARSYRPP